MQSEPINNYGTHDAFIEKLRRCRPMDLSAKKWREEKPESSFADWQKTSKTYLHQSLNLIEATCELDAVVTAREESHDDYIREDICFNTTPWSRVNGTLLLPKGISKPVPAVLLLHGWGGPIFFGRDRIMPTGRTHPVITKHRDKYYGGSTISETFVRQGYAVFAIDAYFFGERALRGIGDVPDDLNPFEDSEENVESFGHYDSIIKGHTYTMVRQLAWAGTTLAGINLLDERRCLDYMASRDEIDGSKLACTGISGGAWRTNILAALDDRIRCAASVCWMTIGDYQQQYNPLYGIGAFNVIAGLWGHMDVPDLSVMTAPRPLMVVSNLQDSLWPNEAKTESKAQIEAGYAWAGASDHVHCPFYDKGHVYDLEIQQDVIAWFDQWLK